MTRLVSVLLLASVCGACAADRSSSGPRTVTMASEARSAEMLGRMKSLEGEWLMKGPDGKMTTACIIKTTSNGSAVREVMFPGSSHEMTNVYHMDGGDLIMTHYCAMGNQPRMRCTGVKGNEMFFAFDDITNLGDPSKPYMAQMTLTVVDNDHMKQAWRSHVNGKVAGDDHATFELTRKK